MCALFGLCSGYNIGILGVTKIGNSSVILNLFSLTILAYPLICSKGKISSLLIYAFFCLPTAFFVYTLADSEVGRRPGPPYRSAFLFDSCKDVETSLICNNQDILTRLVFGVRCLDDSYLSLEKNSSD